MLTPHSTVTTSAASTTTTSTTVRVLTTMTVTQTATTILSPTSPLIVPRAANVLAVAEDIFRSVLASGTISEEPTSTKNEQRIEAESGLANACSCEMVDPTATVTESFTLPPVVG
jgi:hypothetical protein